MLGALVAVLALMGVVGVQGAWGVVSHEFNAESVPVQVTGGQNVQHVWTYQNKETKCAVATFLGESLETTASTISVHPSYAECTFAGIKASVITTGCDFIFESDTTGSPEHAPVRPDCGPPTSSNKITIDIGPGLCKITVGDTHAHGASVNQATKGVGYTNVGSGRTREILASYELVGGTYEISGAFWCTYLFGLKRHIS